MSPEYAMHGQFSVKSDVFSFGVLLLEIVTGHKNNNFYQSNRAEDLLSYVSKKCNIIIFFRFSFSQFVAHDNYTTEDIGEV